MSQNNDYFFTFVSVSFPMNWSFEVLNVEPTHVTHHHTTATHTHLISHTYAPTQHSTVLLMEVRNHLPDKRSKLWKGNCSIESGFAAVAIPLIWYRCNFVNMRTEADEIPDPSDEITFDDEEALKKYKSEIGDKDSTEKRGRRLVVTDTYLTITLGGYSFQAYSDTVGRQEDNLARSAT